LLRGQCHGVTVARAGARFRCGCDAGDRCG
jgi:hypothetical protein